jgi:fused signal recognition particle receptor
VFGWGKKKNEEAARAAAEADAILAKAAAGVEAGPPPFTGEVARSAGGGESSAEAAATRVDPAPPSVSFADSSPAGGGAPSESILEAEPPAGPPPFTGEVARSAGGGEAPEPSGFFNRLVSGLTRSSSKLADGVTSVFTKRELDEETLDELEELLILSDMGAKAAARIRVGLAKARFPKGASPEEIRAALAVEIEAALSPYETHDSPFVQEDGLSGPRVILFVGVNGSGKTTTIGKIAANLTQAGHKILLVAGDTFRAAAVEQLKIWGARTGAPVMAKQTGADAAGLVFEAYEAAKRDRVDVVLIDTAGRLQNRAELMDELGKIVRVLQKLDPFAPHETFLVLDATVGQNALSQTEAFRHTAAVTGVVMTKLDGTAKGGVLLALSEAHKLPIRFIGVGETAADLQPFSARAFARALVGLEDF